MAYREFDVNRVEAELGVRVVPGAALPHLAPAPVPGWLTDYLARAGVLRVASEKARGEFIIAPLLLAVRELTGDAAALFSGETFDMDKAAGLAGEVDYLLALCLPTPILRAPIVAVVEAKRQEIEAGVGQCVAQMVATRRFNERNGLGAAVVYGCVTTGEDWQFLKLDGQTAVYHTERLYRSEVGRILAAFLHVVAQNRHLAA